MRVLSGNVAALLQLGKWFDYLRETVLTTTRASSSCPPRRHGWDKPRAFRGSRHDAESFALAAHGTATSTAKWALRRRIEFMSPMSQLLAVKRASQIPGQPVFGRRIDEVRSRSRMPLPTSFEWGSSTSTAARSLLPATGAVRRRHLNKNAWHSVANKAVLIAER